MELRHTEQVLTVRTIRSSFLACSPGDKKSSGVQDIYGSGIGSRSHNFPFQHPGSLKGHRHENNFGLLAGGEDGAS
jgi:hypothetical protein